MKSAASATIAAVTCAVYLCAFLPAMSAGSDVASLLRDGFKALADNRNADAIALLSAAIGSGRYTRAPGTAAAIAAAYRCRADAYERL
jgi:hypothetical protein